MPVTHARSGTRGLPPFGRRGEMGRNGSTRSHNVSGSSVAAIAVHITAPQENDFLIVVRTGRYCYRFLVGMSLRLLKFGGGSVDDYAICRSS